MWNSNMRIQQPKAKEAFTGKEAGLGNKEEMHRKKKAYSLSIPQTGFCLFLEMSFTQTDGGFGNIHQACDIHYSFRDTIPSYFQMISVMWICFKESYSSCFQQ